MKRSAYILAVICLIIASCKEEPPAINFDQSRQLTDTFYINPTPDTPQLKTVLLEDISGVKCVNCPDAAVIANGIVQAFPERVNVVVLHPDLDALSSFVKPIDKEGYKSKYDFRTKDAAAICNLVGVPGSLPRGLINRVKFADQPERTMPRTDWHAKAQEELNKPSPVNIDLHSEYQPSTQKGSINVKVQFTEPATGKYYISVALIEDSLIDVQEYQDPVTFEVKFNPEYVHMHILRDVITAATGDLLNVSDNATLVKGRVFERAYEYDLSPGYVPKNTKILVFVHDDSNKINVIQSKEIHVVE